MQRLLYRLRITYCCQPAPIFNSNLIFGNLAELELESIEQKNPFIVLMCISVFLVLIISMEIAYVISGLLFALLVEEWVWDYAITITIIHITVTSAGRYIVY